MAESSVAQLTTFAVQYATAELLKSWRLHPSAVLGQCLGECAAACVSGIITLKEAVHVVLIRSTLQDEFPKNGRMAPRGGGRVWPLLVCQKTRQGNFYQICN